MSFSSLYYIYYSQSRQTYDAPATFVAQGLTSVQDEAGWAQICSMIFVKSRDYAPQKEYRFALLSIRPDVGEVATCGLRAC